MFLFLQKTQPCSFRQIQLKHESGEILMAAVENTVNATGLIKNKSCSV